MPLNTSGQLSLGGATTGESVNLELGKSATATISMNDGDVRTLVNIASGVIRLPTDFYGKSTGPSYTRWYITMSTPFNHLRNLTFNGVSYSNSSSDPGLYIAMFSTFLNPGQTPYRARPWFWKLNTDTQTLAWVQRAPVFDLTVSSTSSVQNTQLAAVGSNGIQYRGGGGISASLGSPNFCTPIDTSTGAYTGTIRTTSVFVPPRSDSMFPTHNKQDCYFVRQGSTSTANVGYVSRLIPNTLTEYPFHIRSSAFASRFNPISIDATNRIALFSAGAPTSGSSSPNTYQLHELDADFNIISGFNFTGELAGITRNNATSLNFAVSHNKNIVGNQNIFIAWGQFTPAQGITGIRVACMNFATKTITWQRQFTSTFSSGLYQLFHDQQSGPGHGIIATDDGGCLLTWGATTISTVPATTEGYISKLSASGVHQFTNQITVNGFQSFTTIQSIQPILATRGSGFVIGICGGPGASSTSGISTGYLVNLSADPSISNVMPSTSIGNGLSIQITNATQVTVSSMSPSIGLTTESPTFITRQANSGNVPTLSDWTGTLGAGQVSTFITPTVGGGTI